MKEYIKYPRDYDKITQQIEANPQDPELYFQRYLLLDQMYQDMSETFDEADSDELDRLWKLCAKDIVADLTSAIKLKPEVKYYLKRAYYSQFYYDGYNEILADSFEILKQDPQNLEALAHIGRCYGNQGKVEDAKKIYQQMIEIGGEFDPYHSLADIYIEEENYDEAFAIANKAEVDFKNQIDPNSDDFQEYIFEYIHTIRAKVYLNKEDYQKYSAEYDLIIEALPDNEFLRVEKAEKLADAGQYELAEKDFLKIVENGDDENNGYANIILGNMYRQKQEYEKALMCYEKSVKDESINYGYFMMTEVYVDMDNIEKVKEYVDKSVEQQGDYESAVSDRIKKYLRKHDGSKGGFFSKLFK